MPKTVLIVDDQTTLGYMVGAMVEVMGHRAEVFSHPQDCLAWLERETPDVALLDLMMPGINGVALLEEIRGRGHQFPVYAITGYAGHQLTTEALELGVLAVIVKPISMETVQALVELDTEAAQARPAWRIGQLPKGAALLRADLVTSG